MNINPEQQDSLKVNPARVLSYFGSTDKSLTFKNQHILYGNSNVIYFSQVNKFEYFPLNNYIEVPTSSHIKSINPYFNSLLVQTETAQYLIKGNTPRDFQLFTLDESIGTAASRTAKPIQNDIFALTQDGVYATVSVYNNNDRLNVRKQDESLLSMPFTNGMNTVIMPIDSKASATVFKNKYFLHTPLTNTL
ncbi:MAG: hypothetical protein ACRCXT_08215 [Paraclostridium sp.]